MRVKGQTAYDIRTDQFKYLPGKEEAHSHRVDINVLNKRLNETKKSDFYFTTLILVICASSLVVLSLIGIMF
jgi:hypothetical protein